MRAKTIPFSSEAGTAALGQLTYEPSSVPKDCLADETCYEKLKNLVPSAKAGVLGNFSLWQQMTQTNQRLSAPNVSCAFADAKGDGVCAGSLAELNALLYGAWYKANRTDIDYEPENTCVETKTSNLLPTPNPHPHHCTFALPLITPVTLSDPLITQT
mgnify:FL=1|eukprot:scaffold28129_cov60-Phaeocystis_antarctica.AAC.3